MGYTGIDRRAVELQARAIVLKITQLPEAQVIIGRDASNEPAPIRPFVSIFCRVPSGEVRSGERRYAPVFEYWRAVVNGTTDGTYSLTISGVTHSFVASGLTATAIRDGLATAAGASLTSTVTSPATISIDIEATTVQDRLLVQPASPSGTELSVQILRTNAVKITTVEAEPVLELFCWGKYDPIDPGPEDFGESTAEDLAAAFLDNDENAAMRKCGVVPRTATFQEQDRILDGEVETIGVIQIPFGNLLTHVRQIADTTAAQHDCTL